VHRFDNLGGTDVKQLAVISPAIMSPAYFREAAEVIGAAAGGPPDRAKVTEVFRRHGMTVAAPLLTDRNDLRIMSVSGSLTFFSSRRRFPRTANASLVARLNSTPSAFPGNSLSNCGFGWRR
jgi:hypothetical protein